MKLAALSPPRAALFAALGIALVLRLQALTSAYWFDEILSTSYALTASGIAELYARTIDNNHLLNSLAIHWIGPRDGWIGYRGLAFGAGIALLGLAVFEPGRTQAERVVRAWRWGRRGDRSSASDRIDGGSSRDRGRRTDLPGGG